MSVRPAKTQIGSESSLCAQPFCWFCHVAALIHHTTELTGEYDNPKYTELAVNSTLEIIFAHFFFFVKNRNHDRQIMKVNFTRFIYFRVLATYLTNHKQVVLLQN